MSITFIPHSSKKNSFFHPAGTLQNATIVTLSDGCELRIILLVFCSASALTINEQSIYLKVYDSWAITVQSLQRVPTPETKISLQFYFTRSTSKVLYSWSVLCKKSTNGPQTKKKLYSPGYNLLFDIITLPSTAFLIRINGFVDVCSIPYRVLFDGLPFRGLLLVP